VKVEEYRAKVAAEALAKAQAKGKKTARKNEHPEQDIQIQFVGYLRAAAPDLFFFSVPNERQVPAWLGVILKQMGLRPGASDLVFLWTTETRSEQPDGIHFHYGLHVGFLEMKAPGGRWTDNQQTFAQDTKGLGPTAHYGVAYSMDEGLALLRRWGAL
jgi:hypothetical protein